MAHEVGLGKVVQLILPSPVAFGSAVIVFSLPVASSTSTFLFRAPQRCVVRKPAVPGNFRCYISAILFLAQPGNYQIRNLRPRFSQGKLCLPPPEVAVCRRSSSLVSAYLYMCADCCCLMSSSDEFPREYCRSAGISSPFFAFCSFPRTSPKVS